MLQRLKKVDTVYRKINQKIRFYEKNEQHLQWVLVDEVHVAINQWSRKVLNLIQNSVFRIQNSAEEYLIV